MTKELMGSTIQYSNNCSRVLFFNVLYLYLFAESVYQYLFEFYMEHYCQFKDKMLLPLQHGNQGKSSIHNPVPERL